MNNAIDGRDLLARAELAIRGALGPGTTGAMERLFAEDEHRDEASKRALVAALIGRVVTAETRARHGGDAAA